MNKSVSLFVAFALLLSAAGSVPGQQWNGNKAANLKDLPWIDVRHTGAVGNGVADDTAAIRRAISAAPDGGVVLFPAGRYRVTDEFVIDRPISIAGVGRGSQIFQSTQGKSIFVFEDVFAIGIRDLWLGSASDAPGSSLIALVNSHHNRIDRVIMLGGYYGVHLKGSLLNTVVDLKSGTNFQAGFFAWQQASTNEYWVFGERYNGISANANTFVAPTLEGGRNGIRLVDSNGEGSLYLYGGTIEGISNYGVYLDNTGLPSLLSGVHMEANGVADVYLNQSSRVRLESLLATNRIEIAGGSRNTTVSDSLVEKIVIGPNAVRTRVLSTEMNLSGNSNPFIEDQSGDSEFVHVSPVTGQNFFATTGMGTLNPSSNPVGLTPTRRLEVSGDIQGTTLRATVSVFAQNFVMAGLDGEQSWRLGHAGDGVYLENLATGHMSRLFTESDVTGLTQALERQGRQLQALQEQLEALRQSTAVGAGASVPIARARIP